MRSVEICGNGIWRFVVAPPHHVDGLWAHAHEHSAEGSTSSRTSASSSARTAATRKLASSITWNSTIAAFPMCPPFRSVSWPRGS